MKFIFLSDSFYKAYIQCSEIEQKRDRPYIQACVQMGGRLFAVPMRSHIKHKYVLWTDKENNCGLDFSKAVVLKRQEYIDDTRQPYVRPNEFESLRGKDHLIKQKLVQYINVYKKARKRLDVPRNRIICQYSTLQYFEDCI